MADADRLAAAYRRIDPGGDHVSDDQWERLACHELTLDERQALLDHVLRCSTCSDVWRSVAALEDGAAELGYRPKVEPLDRRPRRGRWLRSAAWAGGLAAAAALLLAIIVPRWLPEPGISSAPVGADTLRSEDRERPVPVAPIGVQTATPEAFVWRGLGSGWVSRVELFDHLGEPVWTSAEMIGERLAWPDGVEVEPGLSYWRVVSRPERGGLARTSSMVSFELR